MTSPFTVNLVRSGTANPSSEKNLEKGKKREIWLKSTSAYVASQDRPIAIALEKIHDDDPSGAEPLDSNLSFVIAIGKPDEDKNATPPTGQDGVLFSDHVRVDKETEHPFIWKATVAKPEESPAYSISLADGSEIVSSLLDGDFIYLEITFEPHGVQPFQPDLFGLQRAAPLFISSQSSGGPGGGGSRPLLKRNPGAAPDKNDHPRPVRIGRRPIDFGWGPIGYLTGILCAFWQETWQHWVVVVGDMYHELLHYGERRINFYQNGLVRDHDFSFESVDCTTTYNNRAIADEGPGAIGRTGEFYFDPDDGINCQMFCIELFRVICPHRTKRFEIYGRRDEEF